MKVSEYNYTEKYYNQIRKLSEKDFKREECIVCGKKTLGFCNSHSVPAFILRNIAENGYVYSTNKLTKYCLKDNLGIKEAGTFRVICRECDNSLFRSYESEGALKNIITEEMMNSIALKCLLLAYYKSKIGFYSLRRLLTDLDVKNEVSSDTYFGLKEQVLVHKIDSLDLYQEIKEFISKRNLKKFKILFWEVLDYKIPISFQNCVTLHGDLKGYVVNDVYNHNESMEHMFIGAFPLKDVSIVMAFYPAENTKYDRFEKQFLSKCIEEQLEIINYIVFLYTEDYFIAPNIESSILTNKIMMNLAKDINELKYDWTNKEKQINFRLHQLRKRKPRIPNLLSREYALS